MGDNKINREYFAANFNNVTGSADSGSGGSAGSGMDCLPLRQPGPFHYLISEQAKSLVALQELQNEVGALLEFRDLVIETFPNLRCKMAPAPAAPREWEPGVRVRRKLAAPGEARAKPQPSVQDSGFSTETSCGKDAHSSGGAAARRPLEDELWALLDVIQRKGLRVRDEVELLRAEMDERADTAERSFARALEAECSCGEARMLRAEREQLIARAAALEAAAATPRTPAPAPLGRLDRVLETPARPPRVATPDTKKFAAILQESNPAELQRQLLMATVQTQVLSAQKSTLLDKLDRVRDENDDLKFQLEEKTIELEGTRAKMRQLDKSRSPGTPEPRRSSMRDLQPLPLGDEARIADTPRRRPSRIPLHTARGPRSRTPPARPPSAASARAAAAHANHAPLENKAHRQGRANTGKNLVKRAGEPADLIAEYLSRTERLVGHRLLRAPPRSRPLPATLHYRAAAHAPQNLAAELSRSVLYDDDAGSLRSLHSHGDGKPFGEDSLWNGKPQKYFESMKYAEHELEFENDSLAA